jgi:hypothetical protein
MKKTSEVCQDFGSLVMAQKKCPANDFFGVAQSPKSSVSGTMMIVQHPHRMARGFLKKVSSWINIFLTSISSF